MKRLTKRYIIKNLTEISVSNPIKYERYYINDKLRIQSKNGIYEKEVAEVKCELEKIIFSDDFTRLTDEYKTKILDVLKAI